MTAIEPGAGHTPWRVLVSGFLDWPATRDAAAGFDRWRCLENPSGRLFIGHWHDGGTPPAPDGGELPRLLSANAATGEGRPIQWRFAVLPVLWRIAQSLDTTDVDVVVNIGLGVYDAADRIVVEQGAANRRSARCDASGAVPGARGDVPEVIEATCGAVIRGTPVIEARLDSVTQAVPGSRYKVEVASARTDNAFVCNETHALMLRRVANGRRPDRVFFIHIPKPATDEDYGALAHALAAVIIDLVMP